MAAAVDHGLIVRRMHAHGKAHSKAQKSLLVNSADTFPLVGNHNRFSGYLGTGAIRELVGHWTAAGHERSQAPCGRPRIGLAC